jgi:putative RNA 2'-phosphotransferase
LKVESMQAREQISEIRQCPRHGYFRGSQCNCGNPGRFILSGFKAEKLGRIISGALRHFPVELGLKLDEHGWANIDDLEKAIAAKYPWASREHIEAMLETDEKGRYEYDGERVRARYGHSIKVDLDYPEADYDVLFYGTSEEEADRILEIGLKPVNQHHVHLSTQDMLRVVGRKEVTPCCATARATPRTASAPSMTSNPPAPWMWVSMKPGAIQAP